ncbi:recombinase family protein [Glutamicibacter ardleyensis]|uniref:recombinase family protein n=1 Tax=Glutamicibacter ardleyensis TaxID=225894 RepID=UPI003FD4F492
MRASCAEKVFADHGASSRIASWPQWEACLDYVRAGDTLVIWALDLIARTDRIAIEMIRELGGGASSCAASPNRS